MSKGSSRDELAGILQETINQSFKKQNIKVAHFLNGQSEAASDVKEWISTGCSVLDLIIANRPNGGLPVGKIVEITGLEASGKSLLATHVISETQKKGGIGVYIDTESAASKPFIEAIGVDPDKMLYVQLDALEDIFETIEKIVNHIRENDKDKIVTIVVDSIMGASTQKELKGDYEKEGWATDKAIIISKAMRKLTNLIAQKRILLIFTNQLRQKLGVMFGDPYTTSGGKALGFHASVRIRLKSVGQIKADVNGIEQTVGISTKAQVIKNRVGPPLRTAEFDIFFDSGIDDYGNWLKVLKNYKLVKQAGAWYTYTYNGKDIKFQSKDFYKKLDEIKGLRDFIYNQICDIIIMKYRTDDLGIDDVKIDDESPDELQ